MSISFSAPLGPGTWRIHHPLTGAAVDTRISNRAWILADEEPIGLLMKLEYPDGPVYAAQFPGLQLAATTRQGINQAIAERAAY